VSLILVVLAVGHAIRTEYLCRQIPGLPFQVVGFGFEGAPHCLAPKLPGSNQRSAMAEPPTTRQQLGATVWSPPTSSRRQLGRGDRDGRRRGSATTGRRRLIRTDAEPAAARDRRLPVDHHEATATGVAGKDARRCRRAATGRRRLVGSLVKPAAATDGTRQAGDRRLAA